MKRAALFGVLAIAALIAGWILVRAEAEPIEGIWKNDYYGACLCSAENFYLFEDGKIVEYSDTHFTDYDAGRYKELGNGKYEVTLHHDGMPPSIWIVRPRQTSWVHPPRRKLGYLPGGRQAFLQTK